MRAEPVLQPLTDYTPATIAGRESTIERALRAPFRQVSYGYTVPVGLIAVWASCGRNFHLLHDIAEEAGLDSLVYWWISDGRGKYPGIAPILDDALLTGLHTDHLPPAAAGIGTPPTPLLHLLLRHRSGLAEKFDPSTPDGLTSLWQWWEREGRLLLPGPDAAKAELPAAHLPGLSPALFAQSAAAPGVGLIGYPRGEFGLGEDIRLVRASLNKVGIEPVVVRAPWRIGARQNVEQQAAEADNTDFAREAMLYVLPAFDTLTLLNKVGPRAFTADRRIGFWQWELDHFPGSARVAMDLVDEIWCHSEHAAKAFRGATDKPVIKVPLPVSVPDVQPAPRSRFGLPDDAFVVFTSFDGASAIGRKNPLGAIEAFQGAVPRGDRSARLILKAMNTKRDSLWLECLRRANLDDRIVVLDQVVDRPAYYELLKSADVVLSLHRAEGFGRLMADAMAMGIPTVATGYSGNIDFMTEENSWLVEGRFVDVFAGDYAFFEGQRWLEPDRDAAVAALRDCMTNTAARRTRSRAAQRTMAERYSLEACGRRYRELLGETISRTP